MRLHYWQSEDRSVECAGCKISEVKRLLKEKGGIGFTAIIDRDGGLVETQSITLNGNNSKKGNVIGVDHKKSLQRIANRAIAEDMSYDV